MLPVIIGIASCTEKSRQKTEGTTTENRVVVFNFDDKKPSECFARDLGETHPNLVNPENSRADHRTVLNSRADLHQGIEKHLAENNSTRDMEHSTNRMLQKIYFNPSREIETYFISV